MASAVVAADTRADPVAPRFRGLRLTKGALDRHPWTPAASRLDHMGLADEARRLETAMARIYRERRCLTRDHGGAATTREFCKATLEALG